VQDLAADPPAIEFVHNCQVRLSVMFAYWYLGLGTHLFVKVP